MPSGFTFTSGIELTVNNGLTINSTAFGQYGYYSATSYSTNIIVEENLEFTKLASLNAGDGGVGITSTSISTWGSFAINNPDVGNGVLYNGWLVYGDSGYVSSTIPLNTPVILEFAGSTSGMEFYTNSTEFYENPTAIKTPYYLVVAQAGSGAVYTIHWLRVRAYPPNGVMPSVSFGSVS